MWAGALGLLAPTAIARRHPRILLLLGICVGALGAVMVFSYPGLSQLYYLKTSCGAFGILTAVGIAAVVPANRYRYRPLVGPIVHRRHRGRGGRLGDRARWVHHKLPRLGRDHLSGVLSMIGLPILALLVVLALAYIVLRRAEPRWPVLRGAVPLLVIARGDGLQHPEPAEGHRQPDLEPAHRAARRGRWDRGGALATRPQRSGRPRGHQPALPAPAEPCECATHAISGFRATRSGGCWSKAGPTRPRRSRPV